MSSVTTIHKDALGCWNRRDFDGMRNLMHSGYTYTGGDGKEVPGGPDGGIAVAKMYAQAFPDGVVEVKNIYTQGDTAIAEMTARGSHEGDLMGIAPTGKPIEIVICNVMELKDGKIYREREYVDTMAILTQIGAVPSAGHAAGA